MTREFVVECPACGADRAQPVYWPSGGEPIGTEYQCGSIIYDPHAHLSNIVGRICLERQLAAMTAERDALRAEAAKWEE